MSAFLLAGCLALAPDSDQITALVLAPAFPGMESVPPDTPLALAPAPGVPRIFHRAEMLRWAGRFGFAAAPDGDICVERPVRPVEPGKILAVLRAELPAAEIEILDWSRRPAPAGETVFPISGLTDGPSGSLWKGYVRYGGRFKFPLWVRVKVQVAAPRVVATTDLKAGQPISREAVRVEMLRDSPAASGFAGSVEEVAGMLPRVPIRSGSAIRRSQLAPAPEVTRGEMVRVDVWSGLAHLEATGRAEGSGRSGQNISVLNPDSGRRFRARIQGKGRVSVDASSEE